MTSFAALVDSSPPHVALDLAAIRLVLDLMVPIQAKISRKRWANLRSDLAAAIAASGLLPMLKTSTVELSESWASLLGKAPERRMRDGRRGSLAGQANDRSRLETSIGRWLTGLLQSSIPASLVRKIAELGQTIVRSWNRLAESFPDEGLAADQSQEANEWAATVFVA